MKKAAKSAKKKRPKLTTTAGMMTRKEIIRVIDNVYTELALPAGKLQQRYTNSDDLASALAVQQQLAGVSLLRERLVEKFSKL